MKPSIAPILSCLAISLQLAGCAREPEDKFVVGKAVEKLAPESRAVVVRMLEERCGKPGAVRLLGSTKTERQRLKLGAAVYRQSCQPCHGASGDGNGPAARILIPHPRDYRPGIFKFTSTTYGSKPLRSDLVRTVRRGILGTSMPAFDRLSDLEVDAVVDYVLALTHRGELELALAEEVEFGGGLEEKQVPELVAAVLKKWDDARSAVVTPQTPTPELSTANVEAGRASFTAKGCIQCHGPDGRGQTRENIGVDGWGNPTKAADLTSGMLRGGTEPLDVYRHIDAGINGTPMPSFHAGLQSEPETAWNLVAYVVHLANVRRRGELPEAGLLKPLPGVAEPPAAENPESDSALPTIP